MPNPPTMEIAIRTNLPFFFPIFQLPEDALNLDHAHLHLPLLSTPIYPCVGVPSHFHRFKHCFGRPCMDKVET